MDTKEISTDLSCEIWQKLEDQDAELHRLSAFLTAYDYTVADKADLAAFMDVRNTIREAGFNTIIERLNSNLDSLYDLLKEGRRNNGFKRHAI